VWAIGRGKEKEAEPDKTVSPKHETCTELCLKPVGEDVLSI